MIDNCIFCEVNLKYCTCNDRINKSNMIDSSIFIGAFEEEKDADRCKAILEGAKQKKYIGYITTIILGEIMKKLLKIKNDEKYRYTDIYNGITTYLEYFKILHIGQDTLNKHRELNGTASRQNQSHDELNLACAIINNCKLFIMKDMNFGYKKAGNTEIIQISDKTNQKLKALLDKIDFR